MGRPATDEPKSYHVEHMNELHHEALRLLVIGWRPKRIAQHLGLTESFISALRNSPIARDRLEVLSVGKDAEVVEASRIIAQAQPKAAKLLADVINGDIPAPIGEQIKTAQDILSRGGNSPIQRVHGEFRHGLTEDSLNEIKERAAEARMAINTDYSVEED